MNKLADEEKNYRQTLAKDPENIHALVNLGKVLSVKGDFKESKNYFEQALKHLVFDAWVLTEYGYTLFKLEELEKAEEIYRKVLDQNPAHLQAAYYLGILYERLEEIEKAIEVYQESFKQNPYSILLLREIYQLTGKKFYLPWIQKAELLKELTIDNYKAKIIGNIKSVGNIRYKYLLLFYEENKLEPIFYVSLEINTLAEETDTPIYFLCSFSEEGHSNFGFLELEATLDNFAKKALEIVAQKYGFSLKEQ